MRCVCSSALDWEDAHKDLGKRVAYIGASCRVMNRGALWIELHRSFGSLLLV